MVPSQLSKLARKHHCTELMSMWHFRACFLFRPSSSFQIALILLLLQWIRMPFIIISFYFVPLLKLQDNYGFTDNDRHVFVSKISSNSIAFKWLTPTHARTNFFNQIYNILASFTSYCPLSTRPNVVAHTSSSTLSLTFSSISWA